MTNQLTEATNNFLQYDLAMIHNELYELMDRYFENLDVLRRKYESNELRKYNRGSTDTIFDKVLDKIQSLINTLKVEESYKFKNDLYAFEDFIDKRRDTNHPDRFYIRMYKDGYFQ